MGPDRGFSPGYFGRDPPVHRSAYGRGVVVPAEIAERRQLRPQIRRVELARRAGSKPVVRYRLTVDTGIIDGKRKQLRRRYRTEKEARAALAEIQGQVNAGSYVQPSTVTVEQAWADWLQSRHKIRPTTEAGYEYVLQPVRSELGDLAVQDLTRRHIDDLIVKLRAGSLERPGGRAHKAWSARSCNSVLSGPRAAGRRGTLE